ncbi:MAG: DUF134 domain-containing protein [Ignavibacteria bacterium]|jgi:predicted DNA-binding protein (UPF0251 family)
MARPVKPRRLIFPHREITFFPESKAKFFKGEVKLLSEEYEVIKLIDYENMNHLKAAKVMGISRPTITRIYERARKKIAEALVEIKSLKIEEGNVYFGENWYKCRNCESFFNIPCDKYFGNNCPLCLNNSLQEFKNVN